MGLLKEERETPGKDFLKHPGKLPQPKINQENCVTHKPTCCVEYVVMCIAYSVHILVAVCSVLYAV